MLILLPFIILLASYAIIPSISGRVWQRHAWLVSGALSLFTAYYYVVTLGAPDRLAHAIGEFARFIVLIGSLYIISGGISIIPPRTLSAAGNTLFLGAGTLVAGIIGTTGASMLLIRPYLTSNRSRLKPFHIVFFIFLVSNIGGLLTPIGDPPLLMGYLAGIPFFWFTGVLWMPYLGLTGFLLFLYYILDRISIRKQGVAPPDIHAGDWRIRGWLNICLILVVVASVFVETPVGLREGIMLAATAASVIATPRERYRHNGFSLEPLAETAALFVGIFITILPVIDRLQHVAQGYGHASVGWYFWGTGVLSGFLDNAPTFLSAMHTAIGGMVDGSVVPAVHNLASGHPAASIPEGIRQTAVTTWDYLSRHHPGLLQDASAAGQGLADRIILVTALLVSAPQYLVAIALAAVCFGGMTYVGNAPNILVRGVAEKSGVVMPGFGSYLFRYAVPVLLPAFVVLWLVLFL